MSPDQVEEPNGMIALEAAEKKFGTPSYQGYFSKQKQADLESKFLSKKENQNYKPGKYVLADVIFSRAIQKGAALKRGLLCEIEKLDFSQEPVLFVLKSYITKQTLPIKYHKEQIFPLLANPEKVEPKFKQIIQQRDSR